MDKEKIIELLTIRYQEGDFFEIGIPCEVYSRIVGYIRPLKSWANHKRQEFKERPDFTASLFR